MRSRISLLLSVSIVLSFYACTNSSTQNEEAGQTGTQKLVIRQNDSEESISVFREGQDEPILTQNAREDFRPYLHPIVAPDGKGVLTEYSPDHHKHQTGLYWGFTRVNGTGAEKDELAKWFYDPEKPEDIKKKIGRDFFHFPDGSHWQKVSADVLEGEGEEVSWRTVYNMLDETGTPLLEETQTWTFTEQEGKYLISLTWEGKALTDITINEFDYGGLFLRMPWHEGIKGEVVNAARQRNEKAEGQRAMWVDVGMQVEGRDDLAHIAIFDHPENKGFPQTWRVDNQLGIGPVRARMGDWTIDEGQTETIQHRLVVYTGELDDVEMKETWDRYIGQEGAMYSTASLWEIAQQEGRDAKFLTPEEAVESMTVLDGYKVNTWASEPMMSQPMAFCWDDRGRLWIAENLDYESRGSGFSNDGNSRILILEDTDHDGKADSRKVFLEGIPFPAAIAVGFDGVFLGAPPNLLFVPDRNGDDVADEDDIEIRLTGWGIRDRHETLNSLHWGPDGWLYGCQGFATPSKVGKPDGNARLYKAKEPFPDDILEGEGVDFNGGVWRYHPTKDRFEVVAHGFSNPWGIDYDAKGQLFISACVIPHLWHVIPGGIYHRQGGQHFNPYVYEDIKTIADHRHRSAHGGARIYQSDAFPASQRGRLFMANIHEHAVLTDVLEPQGSGFVARHGDDFLMANNAQWIGFSMEIGPEGGVYVLDWHDADICGKEVLNKETGRIFRIMPENSQAEDWEGRYSDLNKMTDAQLVDLQTSESEWHARRARVILQNRAAKGSLKSGTHEQLRKIYQANSNADWRLRAMWALHVTQGFTTPQLQQALNDKDQHIRAWAVQLLCEDQSPSSNILKQFARMAADDPSPVVRLYLAAALQRVGEDARWGIAEELMAHKEDSDDHNLPKMIWYGFESLVEDDPSRALALASESQIPMLAQFTARRAVDADATDMLVEHLGKNPKTLVGMLKGTRDGLEGRSDLTAPANWSSVYNTLKQANQKEVSQLALEIAQQFGDTEAARQYLATLQNQQAPLGERKKALQGLAEQQREELLPQIPKLLENDDLRTEAIRAVASFDDQKTGQLLLNKYAAFNADDKLEAVQTLASRPQYGWLLTQAIKNENIPKRDIPAYVARQLRRVVGSGFVEVWGPIDELSNDLTASYEKYRTLLTDAALSQTNPEHGRVLFARTCGPCHKMYGEGGNVGPDITGSNRHNVEYILSNVLDPSGEIQDDYKMIVVTTRDGRTYAGNIASETERQLTLRVVGQEAVVINKSEIQSQEETPNSMMPPGLFSTLTDEEVLDLVAYLRTDEQVNLP
uniref:PmoA family protein n=1 Tax=Roseihalotalea indica TaxID=2867963 RepID=A0AA49JJM7_9BACT|nr:PmoA family protein [Tunicatimonas sp. TK19036]